MPVDRAREKLTRKGGSLHAPGERGISDEGKKAADHSRHGLDRPSACGPFFADRRNSLCAAVDTDRDRASAFAKEHGIAHVFGGLGEALEWGAFDAAVNATPDGVHYPTTMQLIEAGKAVFCEKPLAVNHEMRC